MILRLICPECRKDSYSASAEAFKACPYCGVLFSGRHGTDKRADNRLKKEIPFIFSFNGQHLSASTLDISEKGFSIKIFGKPLLPVGDVMEFNVGDSPVKAQVMWVFNDSDTSVALSGFKILEGNLNF